MRALNIFPKYFELGHCTRETRNHLVSACYFSIFRKKHIAFWENTDLVQMMYLRKSEEKSGKVLQVSK